MNSFWNIQSSLLYAKDKIIDTLWREIITRLFASFENENDIVVTLNIYRPWGWHDVRPDNHRWERNEVHRESLTSRRLVVVLFNLLAICSPSPNIHPCNSPPRTLLISRVLCYVRVCRQTPVTTHYFVDFAGRFLGSVEEARLCSAGPNYRQTTGQSTAGF